jgi:hypothetical protein
LHRHYFLATLSKFFILDVVFSLSDLTVPSLRTMSNIWKLDPPLFKKLPTGEAQCLVCPVHPDKGAKIIQMTDGSTKGLFKHAKHHEDFERKLREMNVEKEKGTMDKFIVTQAKGA